MAKKRGLGKSLDALLIGSLTSTEALQTEPRNELCQLSLDRIQRGKYQPRREMNADALEELANSIRAQGVIQPIVVRQLLGGRYEIIAGERRFRAAQMAGLSDIPALIKNIPDETALAIALIENIQRENLNPIEEAIALQRLIEEFSMTHQEVAETVGKSRTNVTNTLRLLVLEEAVKTLLENGDLEMGHARALLSLPNAMQKNTAQIIVDKKLSVRETEQLVRRLLSPKLPNAPKTIDPDIKQLQQDLTHRLRLAVAIQCNNKGKGKVVIRYNNLTELDQLMNYFSDNKCNHF